MKKIKITAAILSLAILTACKSGQPVKTSETETSSVTTTATITATETEPVPETEPAEIAEENEYVQVSADNEFIDFEFIENYQGTADIGDLADKAAEYLAEEFIAQTTIWKFLFSEVPDEVPEGFAEYVDGDGKILPKFQTAYPNDYDGDGRTEAFIVLNAPRFEYDVLQSYLVFADSRGNMELVDSFYNPSPVQLLNYGRDKQIIFGGEGLFGVESHSALFGVKDDRAIVHYRLRGSFRKENCFLSSFGFQGSGALMYYDTVMREYRVIESTNVDIKDIRTMDKTGVFEEYYGENSPFSAFRLVGGKYYCLIKNQMMDWGEPYIYENGEFIKLENSHIRVSYDMNGLSCVIDIDMDKAIAEMKPPAKPYVQVSVGNEFIDFEFIENYQGTTDIGYLADKAAEFLKTTDEYAESMKSISEFSDGEFSDYIVDGVIVPKFGIAYPNDYDGDGREETFIILKMPSIAHEKSIVRDFIIFADSGENMEIIDHTLHIELVSLLNYGRDKQIIFGGRGDFGAEEFTGLYGVKRGDVVAHYSGRISFYKSDCFLSAFGWQGGGDFMYYDTAMQEYRSIMGEVLTIDEMKAIDKESFFAEYYEATENGGFAAFLLIGGKYYCLMQYPVMDVGTIYTCEDGKFTLLENSHVRVSLNENNLPMVKDIDISKAIAKMKPPAEPYVQVSVGNEFIDFEFIKNYQGTTDIGDLADKAVDFLKTTDFYAESMKNISEFSDEEFSDYIADGVIVPKFNIAYPNDYDGDGKNETFIIVSMPTPPHLRYCLIFCGSGGEMQLMDTFGCWFETSMLDYGKYKHLIVGSYGVNGADSHYSLFGVKDGGGVKHYSGRVEYVKENCFLSTFGWQGSGDFMYFDTGANEYRFIQGKEVSAEEVRKMDTDGIFNNLWDNSEWFVRTPNIELIGGKYYCFNYGMMTTGIIYTYENGKFVEQEKSNIRNSYYKYGRTVVDIDIEKAVAKMKKPQK